MKPLCCLMLLSLLLVAVASAQITEPTPSPDRLAYEGLLAAPDGAPVADGAYRLTFRLYDPDQGDEVRWHETQQVSVENGQFAVELGAVSPLSVPGGQYRLGVEGVDAAGVPVRLAPDDGVLILKAGTPSETHSSPLSNGIELRGAQGHGLYVGRADEDGVFVESAGDDGVTVWSAGSPSSSISSSAKNGLEVRAAEGYGLFVGWTDEDGIRVNTAGDDGVVVRHAGSPNTTVVSTEKNGFEVQGAEGYGLFVGWANEDGVFVNTAGDDGVVVHQAGTPSTTFTDTGKNGVVVLGAENNGLNVGRADEAGVHVSSAVKGMFVVSAERTGVQVQQAGTTSTLAFSAFNNGFEVNGAEGHGLYVGHTGEDAIYVSSADGAGIRIRDPDEEAAYLQRAIDAGAGLRNHVVLIENNAETSTNGPDVLALKSSANPATGSTNFITFFNGANTPVGAVEGNSAGTGVTYKSGGGDFAEFLPRLHQGEVLEAGDLVGVFAGRLTKTTDGADQLMVLSDRPAVLGTMPPEEDASRYAAAAFVGQVPVRVAGSVSAGDLLVASGRQDGTARGVSPEAYGPECGPVVGRAVSSSSGGKVVALVGVDEASSLREALARQQVEIEAMRRELAELRRLIRGMLSEAGR